MHFMLGTRLAAFYRWPVWDEPYAGKVHSMRTVDDEAEAIIIFLAYRLLVFLAGKDVLPTSSRRVSGVCNGWLALWPMEHSSQEIP